MAVQSVPKPNIAMRLVLFTVAAATKALTQLYDRQRKIRKSAVYGLIDKIRTGQIFPSQIVFGQIGQRPAVLLDGQTRLRAVVEAKRPVWFTVMTHRVRTLAALRQLYVKIDSQSPHRVVRDMFTGYFGSACTNGLKSSFLDAVMAAAKIIYCSFHDNVRKIRASNTYGIVKMAKAYMDAARQYYAAISCPTGQLSSGMLTRSAVMSVALVTFKYQPAKAKDFWFAVAYGGVADPHDSRVLLREYLIDTAQTKHLTSRQLEHVVAWCWSRYFNGETVRCMKLNEERMITAKPIAIAGTPYNKNTPFPGLSAAAVKVLLADLQKAKTRSPDHAVSSSRPGRSQYLPRHCARRMPCVRRSPCGVRVRATAHAHVQIH